jgi:2-polyprenyl-3-methyl-5-hydroxy-6-metoxy-1,4-benzoquinol methylase
MLNLLLRIYRRIAAIVSRRPALTENGERVDINLNSKPRYALMDMYQKSHYKRYVFAKQFVRPGMACGDFACGSGYGSALLAETAGRVTGVDIKQRVIDSVARRYAGLHNVEFVCRDLRTIAYDKEFDLIVSFETIEHIAEQDVIGVFRNFSNALKSGGILIFSTPYLQKRTPEAVAMGFHQIFDIDEAKIVSWLKATGFFAEKVFYQNYRSHDVVASLADKDFVICVARTTEAAA